MTLKMCVQQIRPMVYFAMLGAATPAFSQGSLTPPGAPGPTMKTLDQLDAKLTQISGKLEPRTPISSLPFSITASGSYYLTTNLAGSSGISIFTNGVTLDLMGFELIASGGSGSGIIVTVGAGQKTNLMVRNGTVRNWAATGVSAGAAWNSLFENLRLSHNGSIGLSAGPGSIIRNCVAMNNALKGFEADRDSLITDCVARNNGNNGIEAPHGSIVSSCIVVSNGAWD